MQLLNRLQKLTPQTDLNAAWFPEHHDLLTSHRLQYLIADEFVRVTNVPEDIRTWARELEVTAKARHALYLEGIKRVTALYNEAGLDWCIIKGAAYWKWYSKPWLRPQDDIDILVHPDQAERAADMLLDTDWEVKTRQDSFHTSVGFHTAQMPDVELHRALTPAYKNALKSTDVLSNLTEESVEGLTLPFPGDIDRLRYALYHCANHHIVTRLLWLEDIYRMLSNGVSTDWMTNLKGINRRSAALVIKYVNHYAGPEEQYSAPIAPTFTNLLLIRHLIPSTNLLTNPITTSRFRQILYNMCLIRNPFKIIQGFLTR